MSTLWERVRNVFTDDLLHADPFENTYLRPEISSSKSAAIEQEYYTMERQRIASDSDGVSEFHARKQHDLMEAAGESLRWKIMESMAGSGPVETVDSELVNSAVQSFQGKYPGLGNVQLLAKYDEGHAQQLLSGNQVANALTDKLNGMVVEIRSQWEFLLTDQPESMAEINAEFTGRISAYNTVALLLHDLDNTGKINSNSLPELLDSESIYRGVTVASAAEREARVADEIVQEYGSSEEQQSLPTTAFLTVQEEAIRDEWQHDLQSGIQNQHDLETYFAGRIDEHNTAIEMAVKARPNLQKTLPPPINYEQLRDDLRQHITAQSQVSTNALGMAV